MQDQQQQELEQEKHCQEAEHLPELPAGVSGVEPPAFVADQQPPHPPHTMDDDPEGAGARANVPAPSPATTQSAVAGLADDEAAAGSGVSAALATATAAAAAAAAAATATEEGLPDKQDASAPQEEDQPVIIIQDEVDGTSRNVKHYEAPLEAKPMSNGTLAGENNTIVRVLDSGQAIIMAPHATSLRPAVLRAIRATMPGARLAFPGEFQRLPPGTDVTFQGFARTQPEPEEISVESLIEETSSNLVLEEATDEVPKKNKGKAKAKEEEAPPPDDASIASSPETPPPEINVAWEKHPERPLQKLPIRFHDAVGRNFIWPWHKAKKWETAKSLIESAFLHVDIIGPHVMAGHYDLLIRGAFADNDSARVSSRLSSYPPQPARIIPPPPPPPPPPPLKEKLELSTSITTVAVIAPDNSHSDDVAPVAPVIENQTAAPSLPPANEEKATQTTVKPPKKPKHNVSKASSSTPSSHPPPPPPPLKPGRGAIILPELWEDIIEPGMVIQMHMWPMTTPPHPPPLPPPPPISHGAPLPPGVGRGLPPMPPGHPLMRRPAPPLIIDVRKPPKGKTRKRQDGL